MASVITDEPIEVINPAQLGADDTHDAVGIPGRRMDRMVTQARLSARPNGVQRG